MKVSFVRIRDALSRGCDILPGDSYHSLSVITYAIWRVLWVFIAKTTFQLSNGTTGEPSSNLKAFVYERYYVTSVPFIKVCMERNRFISI